MITEFIIAINQRGMCSLFINFGTYTCYSISIVFFVKDTQSIYYLRLANKKNSCSLYIPNSCTFCTWSADFLPRVQYQQGMCSLFVNSGTYTCYSIVFFVKDTQSIYYLRLANKKNTCSLCIDNSCTFCTRSADFLPRVQYQQGMCSLFVNSGTYTYYSIVFFVKDTQSIYYLRLANKKNSWSLCIDNSTTIIRNKRN